MLEPVPAALAISLIAHEGCIARLYSECTPAQKARLLPPLIAGAAIGCTGSTEPDAGSDPRAVQTRLHRKGDQLLLSGRKLWITNGSVADVMIVTCRDQRNGTIDGASMVKVVAERARAPFEAREIDTIGLRQGLLAEVVFDDYPVEAGNVIEAGTGATEVLKATWSVNRPLIGLVAVGLAQRAFDMALDYSRIRKQFGKPIAGHQLVQQALSDAATAIESSRLLCHRPRRRFAWPRRDGQAPCTEHLPAGYLAIDERAWRDRPGGRDRHRAAVSRHPDAGHSRWHERDPGADTWP
jgi:alkylation response protein AidB-like acyl-CoA dehydrogenase